MTDEVGHEFESQDCCMPQMCALSAGFRRSTGLAYARTARHLYLCDDLRATSATEVAERVPTLREAHTKKWRFLARSRKLAATVRKD